MASARETRQTTTPTESDGPPDRPDQQSEDQPARVAPAPPPPGRQTLTEDELAELLDGVGGWI